MRTRVAALLLAGALVGVPACRSKPPEPAVVLDGRPRPPDAEGVLTEATRDHLSLDGGPTRPIARNFVSFASQTGQIVNLFQRKDQYVQVGIKNGKVVWLGALGAVLPSKPPFVLYQGDVVRWEGDVITLRDGTVLQAEPGLAKRSGVLSLRIDVAKHRVTEVA